jgi:hypothetical protein
VKQGSILLLRRSQPYKICLKDQAYEGKPRDVKQGRPSLLTPASSVKNASFRSIGLRWFAAAMPSVPETLAAKGRPTEIETGAPKQLTVSVIDAGLSPQNRMKSFAATRDQCPHRSQERQTPPNLSIMQSNSATRRNGISDRFHP